MTRNEWNDYRKSFEHFASSTIDLKIFITQHIGWKRGQLVSDILERLDVWKNVLTCFRTNLKFRVKLNFMNFMKAEYLDLRRENILWFLYQEQWRKSSFHNFHRKQHWLDFFLWFLLFSRVVRPERFSRFHQCPI